MLRTIIMMSCALLSMTQNSAAMRMSKLKAAPLVAPAQPTTGEKAYTATLAGSALLGAMIYSYAVIKARGTTNDQDLHYYNKLKQIALTLPMSIAFVPLVAHVVAAPFKGLYYTISTVQKVLSSLNAAALAQSMQSVYGQFTQR
jgi:hypothetical protein